MKTLVLFLALLPLFSSADTKLSLQGSVLHNVPDASDFGDGADDKPGTGFGLGLRALMGLKEQLHFRSGAAFVQKNFSVEFAGAAEGELDLRYSYLVIPLTLYWKAAPAVGIFFGSALNAKMSDDCDATGSADCTIEDEKSLVFPAIVGFNFNFADNFGIEVSYEHALSETAKDLKVNSAVISLLYHFP